MPARITTTHLRENIHGSLKRRVVLYLLISLILLVTIVYRIAVDGGGVVFPVLALALGLVLGYFLSRMFIVSWHESEQKVISRTDTYGVLIIIGYIILKIISDHFIGEWFSGDEVLTIVLAFAGGTIFGRGLGLGQRVVTILRENI